MLNEGKQKFTPLGKLDLDSLNGKKTVKNSDVKNAKDDKKEDAKPAAVGEAAQKNQTVAVDKQDKATPVETVKNSAPTQDAKPEKLADKQTEPHKNKVEVKHEHKHKPEQTHKADAIKHADKPKRGLNTSNIKRPKTLLRNVADKVETTAPKADAEGDAAASKPAIFTLKSEQNSGPGIKVMGKIDLSTINQNTRPKKKSKEEKRKERENKGQQGGERRKRNRINTERVDINAAANQPNGNKNKGGNNGGNNNNNAGAGRNAK